MRGEWPFDQPRNCAVITHRQVVLGFDAILHVTHDGDDHGWQFLGRENAREEDTFVMGFEEIVNLDPSILQLADLPPRWHAWRRSVEEPWSREPYPCQETE
jgi:hypothetical protein